MSTLVIVLRAISIVAFAAPMLLGARGRHADATTRARPSARDRAPLAANFAAFGLFVVSLLICNLSYEDSIALPLALSGCLVALAGAALVLESRAALGSAWSLLPKADRDLVTSGPYRLVRHPIYLGLTLVATGNALAFGSVLALLGVLAGIVPTFAWRARVEEMQLSRAFGERFALYRQRTKMIIPYVL